MMVQSKNYIGGGGFGGGRVFVYVLLLLLFNITILGLLFIWKTNTYYNNDVTLLNNDVTSKSPLSLHDNNFIFQLNEFTHNVENNRNNNNKESYHSPQQRQQQHHHHQQQQQEEEEFVTKNNPVSTTDNHEANIHNDEKRKPQQHRQRKLNKYELLKQQEKRNNEQESYSALTKFNAIDDVNVLNVHVVPHTHDDVGWRKTVEQYYFSHQNTSLDNRGAVNEILTTVIESLLENPARTFTYVEQKFFTMWWNDPDIMTDAIRSTVHGLIRNGQLAFVNGGWCMHDEATTHYMGMIDQTTLGHTFLYQEFGYIPMVSWQLDPFGHSTTHASLLTARAGMDAVYFGRMDYQDLEKRRATQQCEGIWYPSSKTYNHSEVFWGLTGSYGGNYGPPRGFCFDLMCLNENEPLIGIDQEQLYTRIIDFLYQIQQQSNETQGNHIMLTVGSDFHYQEAHYDYANYDRLISTVMNYQHWDRINISSIFPTEQYQHINVFYSNPEYYTYKKNEGSTKSYHTRSRRTKLSSSVSTQQQHEQQPSQPKTTKISGMNDLQQQQLLSKIVDGSLTTTATATTTSTVSIEDADHLDDQMVTWMLMDNDDPIDHRIMVEWDIKYDDFFPYADCEHCFWTGYFTSRTSFKRLERVTSSFLLAARQIDSMSVLLITDNNVNNIISGSNRTPSTTLLNAPSLGNADHQSSQQQPQQQQRPLRTIFDSPLFHLEDAIGIAQHHDAVAGTAKQHVSDDYSYKLQAGINSVLPYVTDILRTIMIKDDSETFRSNNSNNNSTASEVKLQNLAYCQLLNETKCDVSIDATVGNDTVLYVIVYNPLAQQGRSSVIRLPVSDDVPYRVERLDMQSSTSSVTSPIKSHNYLYQTDDIILELIFDTGLLPPVGATAFRITKISNPSENKREQELTEEKRHRHLKSSEEDIIEIQNNHFTARFDKGSGMIKELSGIDVTQQWGYYPSFASNQSDGRNVNSGAYIFRPQVPNQTLIPISPKSDGARFVNTPVGTDIHIKFEVSWIKEVIRIYDNQPYIEIEYTIGPIPIEDAVGKEIVTRYSSPIQNSGTFYTDSNGREFVERRRNYRPTWDWEVYEPVAGNYYPVNAALYIEDTNASLAVLVDRSQGGSSLTDGSIELMVQRRIVADDSRGVDEAMNETVGGVTPYPPYGNATRVGDGIIIRGTHRIMIGQGNAGAARARSQMDPTFAEPLVFVGSEPISNPVLFQNPSFSGITQALPPNVMLITFNRMHYRNDAFAFLIRLGHQYGIEESTEFSKPVQINFLDVFEGYNIVAVTEKTLGGLEDWQDYLERRLDWIGPQTPPSSTQNDAFVDNTTVTLLPMEIRTFEVIFDPL